MGKSRFHTSKLVRQRQDIVNEIQQNWRDEIEEKKEISNWREGLASELVRDMTQAEQKLWKAVKPLGFEPQIVIAGFIADFANKKKKVAIEVDGSIHAYTKSRDILKTAALQREGYKVLRYSNTLVLKDLSFVLHMIREALK